MAVTSVDLVRIVQDASTTWEGASYTVQYYVHTDDKDTALLDILNAATLPAFGDEFSEIPGVYVTNRDFELVNPNNRLLWVVTLQYNNAIPEVIAGTDTTVVSWGTKVIRRTFDYDEDGKPVVNSVGDPFIPAIEKDIFLLTCRIERDEDDVETGTGDHIVGTYVNTVNDADITVAGVTFLKKTAHMESITADYDPGVGKWKIVYNIVVAKNDPSWQPYRGITPALPFGPNGVENAWLRRVLNAGMREVDGAGNLRPIAVDGEEAKDPKRLLASGAKAEPTDDTLWLGFPDKPNASWTPLNLPTAFPTP